MRRAGSPALRPRDTFAIGEAIDANDALARLMRRAGESSQRLRDLAELLPPGLKGRIRGGTLDDTHWTLLAPDAAAAAKLRNLLPALASELAARGWPERRLRVKTIGAVDAA